MMVDSKTRGVVYRWSISLIDLKNKSTELASALYRRPKTPDACPTHECIAPETGCARCDSLGHSVFAIQRKTYELLSLSESERCNVDVFKA
jgi:hypothetical protein